VLIDAGKFTVFHCPMIGQPNTERKAHVTAREQNIGEMVTVLPINCLV
jgi:hypothetical protein